MVTRNLFYGSIILSIIGWLIALGLEIFGLALLHVAREVISKMPAYQHENDKVIYSVDKINTYTGSMVGSRISIRSRFEETTTVFVNQVHVVGDLESQPSA